MNRGLTSILLALALLAAVATSAAATECSVSTEQGLVQDSDCDSVPDPYDNCPLEPNSLQTDLDRNGIGDACDLVITEARVDPDSHLRQGEIARILVQLFNNQQLPITDIQVRVLNDDLRIDQIQEMPFMPAGEAAILAYHARIPPCAAPDEYPITITSAFRDAGRSARATARITLTVERSDACGAAAGPLDTTVIDVRDRADIDRGENALFPIRITNLGDEQATYSVRATDTEGWATWRVDPDATVSLTSGRDAILALTVETDDDALPGPRTVTVQVTSGQQTTEVPIAVYLRGPLRASPWIAVLQTGLLLIFLLLLTVAVAISARRYRRRPRQRVEIVDLAAQESAKVPLKTAPKRKRIAVERAEPGKRETHY